MIKDPEDHASIIAEWRAVRRYQEMVKTNTLGAFARGAVQTGPFLDSCNTLVLIFAFAVFERVLRILRRENAYPEPLDGRSGVKALMRASIKSLPWVDFDLVSECHDERNKVAHGAKILPRADCWRFIDALEREFIAWNILPGPVVGSYTITVEAAE